MLLNHNLKIILTIIFKNAWFLMLLSVNFLFIKVQDSKSLRKKNMNFTMFQFIKNKFSPRKKEDSSDAMLAVK